MNIVKATTYVQILVHKYNPNPGYNNSLGLREKTQVKNV